MDPLTIAMISMQAGRKLNLPGFGQQRLPQTTGDNIRVSPQGSDSMGSLSQALGLYNLGSSMFGDNYAIPEGYTPETDVFSGVSQAAPDVYSPYANFSGPTLQQALDFRFSRNPYMGFPNG